MLNEIIQKLFNRKDNSKVNIEKTILLIDNNDIDSGAITKALTKRGYRVLTASTGEDGLEITREQCPDIVILDCLLPGIRGIEVCAKLKADEQTKHIPILFLTSEDSPRNVVDCYDKGAENYLTKPISSKVLISQIEMIFNEQPRLEESESAI